MSKGIKRRYVNTKLPGSFSGLSGFQRNVKEKQIKKVLQSIPAYTLHFPRRRRFPRRFVYSPYINAQWGMDLLDVSRFSKSNNGVRFLLVMIDVFSKRMYMEPVKNKLASTISNAIAKIFKRSVGIPERIQADQGKEFFNSTVKELLSKHNITLFYVESEIKCSVVERVNRTIMEKIQRFMTHHSTEKFVHRLMDFENLYNSSFHRSIKCRPRDVNLKNEKEIHRRLYAGKLNTVDPRKIKFKIGDHVLISKLKKTFEKGSTTNYQREVFQVHNIIETNPRTYTLLDKQGEIIRGGFYQEELQKI